MGKSWLQQWLITWLCSIPVWADTLAFPGVVMPNPKNQLCKNSTRQRFSSSKIATMKWVLYTQVFPSDPPRSIFSLITENKLQESRNYLQQWPIFSTWGKKSLAQYSSHTFVEWMKYLENLGCTDSQFGKQYELWRTWIVYLSLLIFPNSLGNYSFL